MDNKRLPDTTNHEVAVVQYPVQTATEQHPTLGSVDVEPDTIKDLPAVTSASNRQKPARKVSNWWLLSIGLTILQALGVSLFFQIMNEAVQMTESGGSGSEFVALIAYVMIVPAVVGIALVNFIGLSILMIKRRPKTMGFIFGIFSLLFSLGLLLFGAYVVYGLNFASLA